MTWQIRWSARAAEQFLDAAAKLEDARVGAGLEFVDEVERLVTIAETNPRRFPRVPDDEGEIRRALVQRFGYWILIDVGQETLVVVAVWHGARDPHGWRAG
jgi:plasmid stabilization system protein ParE